jgi:hypothetical protein
MMDRETRVKVIAEAPKSAQNSLTRAFSGDSSPRGAIKAMCLCCVGFERTAITNCTGYSCPLWKYRPFQ